MLHGIQGEVATLWPLLELELVWDEQPRKGAGSKVCFPRALYTA